MKIFDFTNGTKGDLINTTARASRLDGWLVRKGDRVFKVELASPPAKRDEEWEWHGGAGALNRDRDGQVAGSFELKPEDFGVEAICFCHGKYTVGDRTYWQWVVVGTTDWNRKACQTGILKATFTHTSTVEDRIVVALDALSPTIDGAEQMVDEYAERFDVPADRLMAAVMEARRKGA